MARPPRLRSYDYSGYLPVFLTTSAYDRRRVFADADVADAVVAQLLTTVAASAVEVTAYCLMPDHAHVLLTGMREDARPLDVFVRWKQRTGQWYRQRTGARLWQEGYWDHVLRDTEDVGDVVRYILGNPVRAGLVTGIDGYRWMGSVYSRRG
jgi:putative transposase